MARSRGSGGNGKDRRRCVIPGIWEHQRGLVLRWIEIGDPRAHPDWTPGWTDADRKRVNDAASAEPSRQLALMDERGWVETGRLSAREWPEAAPWLTDRSVPRLRIGANDSVAPAPPT